MKSSSFVAESKGKLMKVLGRVWVFALFLLVAAGVQAQDSQVSGQIRDASKAAVSGANVTLTRNETGDHREVVSTDQGYYSFPLLLPGHYDLKVEKEGFEVQVQTGIVVETASISTVDVTMAVGSVTQTVDVDASLQLLQSETAAISHVVENQTITNMPLLDRRSAQLQGLNGFVVQTGSGENVTFSTAGGRGDNANYLIDGGTAVNLLLGTPSLIIDPPVESLQEFTVAQSNYSAELGRTGGAVVQWTTKSGTNQFHGSAYEYYRESNLAAIPYFSTTNPPLHYNLFGASLGGPIRKDKTHFFFNYEGRREVTSITETNQVPTVAEAGGNFAADPTIYDPLTGLPFPNNVIPQNRFDPIGKELIALYPAPNVQGTNLFRASDPTTTFVNDYVARVDHVFSDNDRLFGRFIGQDDHYLTAPIFPSGVDNYADFYKDNEFSGSATWDHNFRPTLINEVRITYTWRDFLDFGIGAGNAEGAKLAIPGVNQNFAPLVTVSGIDDLNGSYVQGEQERFQQPVISNAYEDSVSWQHGPHQFKFGFAWRTSIDGDIFGLYPGGAFTFNSQTTSNPLSPGNGGDGIASLLLGEVYEGQIQYENHLHSGAQSWGLYAQDDFRVTPNLTVNLGLRYDLDTPRHEFHQQQNGFNPTIINPVSGTPGVVTFAGRDGASTYSNNWATHNFGPRLGFAWKPRDQWVVRAGGGVLFLGEYDQAMPIQLALGFGVDGDFVSSGGVAPAFQLSKGLPPVPAPALTPAFGAVPLGQSPTTTVPFVAANHPTGYMEDASLDIQRQFGQNLLLDIAYLGSFGHHLPSPNPVNINQVPSSDLPLLAANPSIAQSLRPFPQFNDVDSIADPYGNSTYHGLNLGVEKKYSYGLLFKANYTYAKFIDNVQSRADLEYANYGYSNFPLLNYYDPASARGLSGNDIRNRIVFSSVYELPFGRGKLFHPDSEILNQVVGGWSFGVIAEANTGTPLSPIMAVNETDTFSLGNRPDLVANPNLSSGRARSEKLNEWFNTAAFTDPGAFTFGNAPRSFGTGPGVFNMDLSLLKDFHATERFDLQLRLEALNALNHANFANPNTQFGAAAFGQVTGLYSGTPARIVQLGVHLAF
jgi:outer membrane receptor protein involved in Fe transport